MAERSYNGRNLYTESIDSATGDIETTSSAWIEGTTGGWYSLVKAASIASEFDSAVTRTGRLTLKMSNTSIGGRNFTGLSVSESVSAGNQVYLIPVNPLKQYTIKLYLKAQDLSVGFGIAYQLYNDAGTRTVYATGVTTPTGTFDWTEFSFTITTDIRAKYLNIMLNSGTAGAISTVWADVNSMQITEVLPARTPATSRTTASNRVAVRDMGTALRFDGVDDAVTANSISSLGTGATIAFWFKSSKLSANGCLFANSTSSSDRIGIIQRTDGSICAGYYNGSSYVSPKSDNKNLSNGFWHNVIYTFNGTIGTLCINGVVATGTTQPILASINRLSIGSGVDLATDFQGIIDEPRIWNRALTADEIQNLYLYGSVPQDGLVAEYLFDEASGTTAIDSSGNGNNGTITGATYTTDVPLTLRDSI